MSNTLSTVEIKAIPTPKTFQGAVTHFLASLYGQTIGNPWFIGGAIGIPLLMYFFFAVDQPYSDESVGNGNMQAAIMVGMACYGALTTAGWGTCVTALGRNTGWWRTLALTPLSFPAYLAAQVASAICQAGLATLVTYVVGAFTGTRMTALAWVSAYLLTLICCLPLAAMGFAIGQVVNEQAANFILTMILLVSALWHHQSGQGATDRVGQYFQLVMGGKHRGLFNSLYWPSRTVVLPQGPYRKVEHAYYVEGGDPAFA